MSSPPDTSRQPSAFMQAAGLVLDKVETPALFDEEHVDHTCEVLAGSDELDLEAEERQAALREQIRMCEERLARYRELLDEGEAVATVAKWIADVERERKATQAQLGQALPGAKLTKSQTRALVEALRDIVDVLADADPADKAELYAELGVSLTYHTDGRVAVQALPRGVQVRVGGGT